jgi:hypothetical protein
MRFDDEEVANSAAWDYIHLGKPRSEDRIAQVWPSTFCLSSSQEPLELSKGLKDQVTAGGGGGALLALSQRHCRLHRITTEARISHSDDIKTQCRADGT